MDISVVSLKDGQLLVGRGEKHFLETSHPEKPSWYTPDFFLRDKKPWHVHESYEVVSRLDFPSCLPSCQMLREEPEDFREMYESMNLEKGVVYTRCKVRGFNPLAALSRLNKAYIYATEGIVGATPEILFELTPGHLHTMALAATAERLADLEQEKEQEEQGIVVTSIVEALKPYGEVELGKKSAVPYGKLFHLHTPISLKGMISFEEAVNILHPTPAVGAWPKETGKIWLWEQEKRLPRKRYAAPFGYVFPERGEARAFVAIRCVQWDSEGAYLWAGAGITAKSEYEKEKEEINKKFEAVSSLMGIT